MKIFRLPLFLIVVSSSIGTTFGVTVTHLNGGWLDHLSRFEQEAQEPLWLKEYVQDGSVFYKGGIRSYMIENLGFSDSELEDPSTKVPPATIIKIEKGEATQYPSLPEGYHVNPESIITTQVHLKNATYKAQEIRFGENGPSSYLPIFNKSTQNSTSRHSTVKEETYFSQAIQGLWNSVSGFVKLFEAFLASSRATKAS